MMKKKSYNFVDLFSGCGGFSCGLEMAGHQCLLGVDSDRHAIETFSKNHPHAAIFNKPIQFLDKKTLKSLLGNNNVDVVIGGPPCQGFSTVGKGVVADSRNHLFIYFVEVVKWLDPKVIIFENVTGLLAKKNAKVLKNIFESFEKLGYSMTARILKAEEFGAPTQRRRAFIIGSKTQNPESFYPAPLKNRLSVALAWKKWLYTKSGKAFNHELKFTAVKNNLSLQRLKCIPEGMGIRYQSDEKKLLPQKLRFNLDWNKLPEKRFRQKKFHRINSSTLAPTVMTSSRTYFHPTKNRYLTVREAAALQTFPATFEFHGSHTAMFKQVGNAVPPLLAKAFGDVLAQKEISHISKKTKRKTKINLNHLRSTAFLYREIGNTNDKHELS